ncbi:MAG: radical SAM protein [Magnetococcales bacterium]|nr:radical SAM protein [Magnetococcales bacterium]
MPIGRSDNSSMAATHSPSPSHPGQPPSPPLPVAEVDSILINTPISSPLHAQLNLPLLQGALTTAGFNCRIVDDNIDFFHDFLSPLPPPPSQTEFRQNPLSILSYYNDLEARLWERSKGWPKLHVGMRSLAMAHDRLQFDSVLAATRDRESNPFIAYYEKRVRADFIPLKPKIIGIAITFQDQLIPAHTLARVIRREMPTCRIVFGGQMITRCQESMLNHPGIRGLADYLILWDGEIPLVNLHRQLIRGEEVEMTNLIPCHTPNHAPDQAPDASPSPTPPLIQRTGAALSGEAIPEVDFSGFDFERYLLPEYLIPVQTTRGCYGECAFCAIPFGSNKYRLREAPRVVAELQRIQGEIQEKHGRQAVYFKLMEDTSSPSLLLEIADEIAEKNLHVRWETFARLEKSFTREGVLKRLYAGGCRKIHWGLETNDPGILKEMNKKTRPSHTDDVLRLSGEAGIMNFCFVLIGFPGETAAQRKALTDYIIQNRHIHTLTLATFDLTRGSPMERDFDEENALGLSRMPAEEFQVRLPYLVDGQNWKREVVSAGHTMMADIVKARPDIGLVTLFPDQVRGMLCDWFGNDWGSTFVQRYGTENVQEMFQNTERYAKAYREGQEIDPAALPEPLRREHFRTREDLELLTRAVLQRKKYERVRLEQV